MDVFATLPTLFQPGREMSTTRRSAAIMGGLVCVTMIQTVTAFSCPMSMALRSSEPTFSAGHVGRRDAMGAFIIAAGQMAALSFLQLKQLPEASGDFSELEVFKFQRGMRKLGKMRSFLCFHTLLRRIISDHFKKFSRGQHGVERHVKDRRCHGSQLQLHWQRFIPHKQGHRISDGI